MQVKEVKTSVLGDRSVGVECKQSRVGDNRELGGSLPAVRFHQSTHGTNQPKPLGFLWSPCA